MLKCENEVVREASKRFQTSFRHLQSSSTQTTVPSLKFPSQTLLLRRQLLLSLQLLLALTSPPSSYGFTLELAELACIFEHLSIVS